MAKSTILDLKKVCHWFRLPYALVLLDFKAKRKFVDSDGEAIQWLIEDYAEGMAS